MTSITETIAEVEAMTKSLNRCAASNLVSLRHLHVLLAHVPVIISELRRLQEENERYRKALEFYADPTNDVIPVFYDEMDFADTARQALKGGA